MLIDSNIIIYAAQPQYTALRQFIIDMNPAVSAVSYVEVLGYHKLTEQDQQLLEAFFKTAPVLAITQAVLDQAVKLRQLRKMTLGDALVAGTALAHNLTLVTRNTSDFAWIAGLALLNPLEHS
jgi:predicted nucleic acid-binding protein